MITLYQDPQLRVVIPESYQEDQTLQHPWCINLEKMYNLHVTQMGLKLIHFLYSDGYMMSLAIKKGTGHWIDNQKEGYKYPLVRLESLSQPCAAEEIKVPLLAQHIANLPAELKELIIQTYGH